VSALALLLVESGSVTPDETLAWLVMLPSLWGLTLTSTFALVPPASVPSEQVTVPAS